MIHRIQIDPQLYSTYPEIRLGLLEFETTVIASNSKFWDDMHTIFIPQVLNQIQGKSWQDISGIRGSRLAYKAFGRNPGRYRVSSEALLRRIKRCDDFYHINSIVDINNLISIQTGLSVGSYDIDQIEGDISYTKALPNQGYQGIGKEWIDMENMLVLQDKKGIFGSSMTDSTRAMVTERTRHIMVVMYCFENTLDLNKILIEAIDTFQKYGNIHNVQSKIL